MDRDIAMVFQNYALYPHMSVYDNMAFGLKMRKFDKAEIKKRVDNAADILGINDHLERKPRMLSGGQRQRVALGRAIVRNPQVFLFDEPLSNLDAKLRVQMRIEIKKLHARLATTSMYVTHDQVEAMTLGDRVVVMNHGLIQQVGEPLELYNNPANKYVAGFIGSPPMNFSNVQIVDEGGTLYATNPAMKIRVPDAIKARLAPHTGKPATLGIRPENLRMATSADQRRHRSCRNGRSVRAARLRSHPRRQMRRRRHGRKRRADGPRQSGRADQTRTRSRRPALLRRQDRTGDLTLRCGSSAAGPTIPPRTERSA